MKAGAICVQAIKDWMKANGRRPVWEELETIIDGALPHEPDHKRTVPKPTQDWLDELRKDPANDGIDVDKELAKAQLWCNQNRRLCTQRFFVNWLMKAERVIAPGRVAINALPELPGWRLFLEERAAEFGIDRLVPEETWDELPRSTREKIHGSKHRLQGLVEFARDGNAWQAHLEQLRNRRQSA